jgi:hypothetical protein
MPVVSGPPVLSITIEVRPSVLDNLRLRENIDVNVLDRLIRSSVLRKKFHNPIAERIFNDEREQLLAYKHLLDDEGYCRVLYTTSRGMNVGRRLPVSGLGLHNIRREIRHTLALRVYSDFDVVNCHPEIILQLVLFCAPYLAHDLLLDYCLYRDKWFQFIMDNFGCSRDASKRLVLRYSYGGGFKGWLEEFELDPSTPEPRHLEAIRIQLRAILTMISQRNPLIRAQVASNAFRQSGVSKGNLDGATTSHVLQEFESRILEAMYIHCRSLNIIGDDDSAVLCADGIMLETDRCPSDLCEQLTRVVLEKTGFNMRFTNKAMDQAYLSIMNPPEMPPIEDTSAAAARSALMLEIFGGDDDDDDEPLIPPVDWGVDDGKFFDPKGVTLAGKKGLDLDQIRETMTPFMQYLHIIPNSIAQSRVFCDCLVYAVKASGGNIDDVNEWRRLHLECKGLGERDIACNLTAYTLARRFAELPWSTDVYEASEDFVDYGLDIDFLKKYARKANPGFFYNAVGQVKRIIEPPVPESFRLIIEDCPFVSMEGTRFAGDVFAPEKVVMIDAPPGRGKTTCMHRILTHQFRTYGHTRVLIFSCRITYALFMSKEFRAQCYKDMPMHKGGAFKGVPQDRFVISMESLHKLAGTAWDVVLLDECETNLSVFSSITMQGRQRKNYAVLTDIIKRSKKVIMASAFLTAKTFDYAESLGMPVCLIRNTTPPPARKAFEVSKDEFSSRLLASIKEGEKPFVCWSSFMQFTEFNRLLQAELPKVFAAQITYTRDTDNNDMRLVAHAETHWLATPLVQCTMSLHCGNSFTGAEIPNYPGARPFDRVWIQGHPTGTAMDNMQQSMRVRYTNQSVVMYCMPDDRILSMNANTDSLCFRLLDEADTYHSTRLQYIQSICSKLAAERSSGVADIAPIVERIFSNYSSTPPPLRQIIMNNLNEGAVSQKYYREFFVKLLQIMNCTVHELPRKSAADKKKKKAAPAPSSKADAGPPPDMDIYMAYDRASIDVHPSYNEVENFEYHINWVVRHSRADSNDLAVHSRWGFEGVVLPKAGDIPIWTMRVLFQDLWRNPRLQPIVHNMVEERTMDLSGGVIESAYRVAKSGVESTHRILVSCVVVIREVSSLIGVNHSILPAQVSREQIVKVGDYLHHHRADIHHIFALGRDQHPGAKNNIKNALYLLNKILDRWNGTSVKADIVPGKKKDTANSFIKSTYVNPTSGEDLDFGFLFEHNIVTKAVEYEERASTGEEEVEYAHAMREAREREEADEARADAEAERKRAIAQTALNKDRAARAAETRKRNREIAATMHLVGEPAPVRALTQTKINHPPSP